MRVDTWHDLNQLLTTAMEWLAETETELALVEARITQHEEEWAQLWAQVQNTRRKEYGREGVEERQHRPWTAITHDGARQEADRPLNGRTGTVRQRTSGPHSHGN